MCNLIDLDVTTLGSKEARDDQSKRRAQEMDRIAGAVTCGRGTPQVVMSIYRCLRESKSVCESTKKKLAQKMPFQSCRTGGSDSSKCQFVRPMRRQIAKPKSRRTRSAQQKKRTHSSWCCTPSVAWGAFANVYKAV